MRESSVGACCSNCTGYQILRFHQCVDETEMAGPSGVYAGLPVDQRVELRRGHDATEDFQGNRGEGDTNKEFRNGLWPGCRPIRLR